jgi:hypothetical protein
VYVVQKSILKSRGRLTFTTSLYIIRPSVDVGEFRNLLPPVLKSIPCSRYSCLKPAPPIRWSITDRPRHVSIVSATWEEASQEPGIQGLALGARQRGDAERVFN